MSFSPYVVTISRELGSGGAWVGKRLAEHLGIFYLDREILSEAANHFKVSEGELEEFEERTTPIWHTFFSMGVYTPTEMFLEPPVYLPTDRELYAVESKIIAQIARERSCVIIGRGGSHILQDHPRHLSVFVHADMEFRLKRVQELFRLSEKTARDLIDKTDKERGRYIQTATGRDWRDVRQYHISINTAVVGLQESADIIEACVKSRFGEAGSEA